MYLCYIDESGTSDLPGNTSHFVLAAISVPIWQWRYCDQQIKAIKSKYDIEDAELHVAWMYRAYLEQSKIPNFESLNKPRRISEVQTYRRRELLRLQKTNQKLYRQTRKNYKKTEAYIHLTFDERKNLIKEVATCVAGWGFVRIFAECIDKIFFDPTSRKAGVDAQALEQVITRFHHYLRIVNKKHPDSYGLLIHDNNETIAHKHTQLVQDFHRKGTWFTKIDHIIETPLFVDSKLTSMVQIADLCAFALRRYLENDESELVDIVFSRADRKEGRVVGVRHYSDPSCECKICVAHKTVVA